MEGLVEKIKENRTLQIILGAVIILIVIILIKLIFFPKKQPLPCYNVTLKVWAPFPRVSFESIVSILSRVCIYFEITEKSLEEIKADLSEAIAQGDYPDIVYLDENYLKKYKNFFDEPLKVAIDTLIIYYNKDVLNFLNLEKPRTFEDLINFSKKIREVKSGNFYSVGLGNDKIKNKKEIIFSFLTLNKDYNDPRKFKNNLNTAVDFYYSFGDYQNSSFVNPPVDESDLESFINARLGAYIGFYSDKQEILTRQPNLAYEIGPMVNTFPPTMKIYRRDFYLVPIKFSNHLDRARDFIYYLRNNLLDNFYKTFDLIPAEQKFISSQDSEKMLVFDQYSKFSGDFSFLENFKNVFKILQENKNEIKESINKYF